ncbi:MAG: alanine dehydrogenase [Bacteroidetes bacterium]|nr:MAG: alanine dehydrogenase [Bacteroidota bacterium]
MEKIIIGLIREGKVPPDHRVPLTPQQCKKVMTLYPNVEVVAQTSPIRAYKDEEYEAKGVKVVDSLENCDIILGVKEVKIDDLIPNKTYLFFSHTIKKQPYNRELLREILKRKIELIDYEVIKDRHNKRLIGFGRYAGIVGCYNGFLAFGKKHGLYDLKPAHLCADRKELELELQKVKLPSNTKIALTGFGRVGHGAREIIDLLPIKEVGPEEYLSKSFDQPVFTHLEAEDYFGRKDGKEFDKGEFYSNPELYKSIFNRFLSETDMYIPCHYWNSKSPFIITRDDLKKEIRLSVVADISCDIDGPIACTIRPSKISDPIYGYDPITESETDFMKKGAIAVMAVDNLPCELPLDASEDFGNEMLKHVIPYLIKDDPDKIIERATETNKEGQLTNYFNYLQPFVNGEE